MLGSSKSFLAVNIQHGLALWWSSNALLLLDPSSLLKYLTYLLIVSDFSSIIFTLLYFHLEPSVNVLYGPSNFLVSLLVLISQYFKFVLFKFFLLSSDYLFYLLAQCVIATVLWLVLCCSIINMHWFRVVPVCQSWLNSPEVRYDSIFYILVDKTY